MAAKALSVLLPRTQLLLVLDRIPPPKAKLIFPWLKELCEAVTVPCQQLPSTQLLFITANDTPGSGNDFPPHKDGKKSGRVSFLLNISGSAEDPCGTNVAMETILLNNIQLNWHVPSVQKEFRCKTN